MENGVLSIAGRGNGSDKLTEVPNAPAYLSAEEKKYFSEMALYLIHTDRLKKTYLTGLEIFAQYKAELVYAHKWIQDKNRKKKGSGYIQEFSSGANNISAGVTLRNNAVKALFQCFKQFGLDPKSDKDLKAVVPEGQLDIFEEFNKANHS